MKLLERLNAKVLVEWLLLSLFFGTMGYHYIAKLPLTDAFLNASLILGGMGPASKITNGEGKIFAAFYALYSGLFFLIVFAFVLHRLISKY